MRFFSDNVSLRSIERGVWFLFLATLAWQTRIILWQADGNFIEWRAISLYASDVLMFVLWGLMVVQWDRRQCMQRISESSLREIGILAAVCAAAVLSLRATDQMVVGVYQVVRLVQFIGLYLYIRHWAVRRFDADLSVLAFVAGGLMQSVLGLAQFLLQHDVGIRKMGETLLQTDMRGVAVFYDLAHVKVLRAYGTLPHPNILAAYLMLTFWGLCWLYIRHGAEAQKHTWSAVSWGASASIILLAMYATYSRTMIAAWVVATGLMMLAVWLKRANRWPHIVLIRTRTRDIIVLVAAVSLAFTMAQWPRIVARMTISSGDEAVRLRVMYNRDALGSGSGSHWNINWTGVGIGNFTSWLKRYDPSLPAFQYQPAHNVFLLVYSELGLLGSIAWGAWLLYVAVMLWRSRRDQPLLRFAFATILGALLFIALFDHFFWTLQQGRIMWYMALALAASHT
jgi:hypothetical protein